MRRLVEADILRTVAIVLIILTHLPDYFPIPGWGPFGTYTILFGNGLFIFLSGYLIHASTRRHPDSTLVSFMGHRLLRLMPLYWLALAVFAVLVARPDLPTLLLHVLGLQVVLAPVLVTPLATLWFIGMILAYYLVYHAAVRRTYGPQGMAVAALLCFLPLVALRAATGLIEVRFFLYYFVFMAGVVVCEGGVMERAQPRAAFLALACSATFLILFILNGSVLVGETPGLALDPSLAASVATADGMIISWTLLGWLAAKSVAPRLSPRIAGVFAACSVASYFVYLFHRPALVIASSVLDHTGLAVPLQYLAALLIVVPVMFLVGSKVQRAVDVLTRRFLERWHGTDRREQPAGRPH
jgi:peptidoglycan/LPS O-acetylase OafA/YrhL